MAIRRIIKPTQEAVIDYIEGKSSVLAYQHVNWWLWQKGSDEIIWAADDYSWLYFFIWNNRHIVVCSMADILGIEHKQVNVYKEHLEKWEKLFEHEF